MSDAPERVCGACGTVVRGQEVMLVGYETRVQGVAAEGDWVAATCYLRSDMPWTPDALNTMFDAWIQHIRPKLHLDLDDPAAGK